MTMNVMVAGAWDEEDGRVLSMAESFGEWLANSDCCLVTGGGTGVAAAAVRGATSASGMTIAFNPLSQIPSGDADRDYSIAIPTGLGWDGRSLLAIRSSDVVVAFGGRAGTLLELVAAYLGGVPAIAVKHPDSMTCRLDRMLIGGLYLDRRKTGELRIVDDLADAVEATKSYVMC